MTENPYYSLIRLIRAQSGGGGQPLFLALLEQAEPPVFSVGGERFSPALAAHGLQFSAEDAGSTYLCLSLDGQAAVLCRLENI